MKKYNELISELRVKTVAQRKKIARQLSRRMKSSTFRKKVERSKLRIASPEKQVLKARKLAKQKIIKKFYPNYFNASPVQRMQIDQRIASKYGAMIEKLAKKLRKEIRQREIEKVKAARERLNKK